VLGLIVALVCNEGRANGDDEEDEQLKQLKLAREANSRLFRKKSSVTPEEAFELLQILESGGHSTAMDAGTLISYADVTEDKCSQDLVLRMRRDFDTAKSDYPALLPYIRLHFTRQFELCGYHVKYKEDFDKFKVKHSGVWGKMAKFGKYVSGRGKVSKDWNRQKLDNPVQHNEAYYDMYDDNKRYSNSGGESYIDRGDAAINAYRDMQDVRHGSNLWHDEVNPSVTFATYHPDSMQDEDLKDTLRHNNVYEQVRRTNYADGMGRAFADAHYDQDNAMWDTWRSWQENYF